MTIWEIHGIMVWGDEKMPKTHQFTGEQLREVENLQKITKNASLYKKLEVLRLRMEGYCNAEIAKITKYSKSRVSALCCIYANAGISYFKEEQRKGGNRRNISYEEEREMLAEFEDAANKGQLITIGEIKVAYDKKCGHETGSGTIYRLMARHKWRKVMPRSRHPKKASDEEILSSKKLTLESKKNAKFSTILAGESG
jgi:transposase